MSEQPVPHIIECLSEVYTPRGVDLWHHRPNRRLGGRCPADLIEEGRYLDVTFLAERVVDGEEN